jgi:hypothetical protein
LRWLGPRLLAACKKVSAGGADRLSETFVHNLPRMMFVFLPLIAFCMRLIYWRPRRYYVEHLLFFIHNHAFVFLVATIACFVSLLPAVVPRFLSALTWLYIAWYCYRALRTYYQQGRMFTVLKLAIMGFVYLVLGGFMVGLTAAYSFLTI